MGTEEWQTSGDTEIGKEEERRRLRRAEWPTVMRSDPPINKAHRTQIAVSWYHNNQEDLEVFCDIYPTL